MKFATCELLSWASDGNVVFFFGDGTAACNYDDFLGFTMCFAPCSLSELMGSDHRSVDGSFLPLNITFPLYQTSHFVLVNTNLHPVLHMTLMPINNAMDSLGTTCPTRTFGSPGVIMLHVCVDITFVPSGKLIVSGRTARRRFLHVVPPMMKIKVAPVSAIACNAAMAIALRYCGFGAPNNCLAVAAIDVLVAACPGLYDKFGVQFDVTTVMSSLSTTAVALIIWVGSKVLA